jgi:hypothetical protein
MTPVADLFTSYYGKVAQRFQVPANFFAIMMSAAGRSPLSPGAMIAP